MKHVIQEKINELANYQSDFSGVEFETQWAPTIELNIQCNYPSDYDGANITLHLTDSELEDILDFIKPKLAPATKLCFKNQIKEPSDNVGIILYLLDNAD
jgi:hypothetical protein